MMKKMIENGLNGILPYISKVTNDVKTTQDQVNVLAGVLQVKDSMIEVLQKQLQERETTWRKALQDKQDIVNRQMEVMHDLEQNLVMFYNLIYKLKEAQTMDDVQEVLSGYNIDLTTMPYVQ